MKGNVGGIFLNITMFIRITYKLTGGEGGIRTLDTLQTYTPLAGARFQPLSHFSENFQRGEIIP